MIKPKGTIEIAKIPLQETRLFQYRYPDWKKLYSKLMPEINRHKMADPKGLPGGNARCWRGIKEYTHQKDLLKPINTIVSGWLAHYFPGDYFRAHVNYWTNINKPGSLNMIHNHVMASCHLSGVYYVQGEKTGAIRFYTHEQLYNLIPDGMPYQNKIGHGPSDGDILLFPSYLQHDVDVNLSNRDRITIGFNVVLKKKGEKSNDEIKH